MRVLRSLLRDLSKRHPMLIVIDDVQWADVDALSVLEELIRLPDPPDLLLLLIVNGELREAEPPLRQWLTRYEQQVTLMRLRELGDGAARELAERLLDSAGVNDPALSTALATSGGGHPLRVDALARHLLLTKGVAPSDLSLTDLMWSRVEHLPLDARQLLITLCHARTPLPAEVAGEAAGLPPDSVGRYMAVLRVANLARSVRESDGERHGPSHAALRQAVLARADVDHARIHRQLALALTSWAKAPPDVLATHLRDANNSERAARAASRAADRARDLLAFDAAVHLYQEALAYPNVEQDEERRLRMELAHAYACAGQSPHAARAYMEAARYANPADALELERRAAHQLLRTGNVVEGLQTVTSVLGRLGVRLPTSMSASVFSLWWRRLKLKTRGMGFVERDASQIPPNDLVRADILGSLARALGMIDSVRGADAQTRHLLLALELGDPVRLARALGTRRSLPGGHIRGCAERCLAQAARARGSPGGAGGRSAGARPRLVGSLECHLLARGVSGERSGVHRGRAHPEHRVHRRGLGARQRPRLPRHLPVLPGRAQDATSSASPNTFAKRANAATTTRTRISASQSRTSPT